MGEEEEHSGAPWMSTAGGKTLAKLEAPGREETTRGLLFAFAVIKSNQFLQGALLRVCCRNFSALQLDISCSMRVLRQGGHVC